jgi:hypothetical protein
MQDGAIKVCLEQKDQGWNKEKEQKTYQFIGRPWHKRPLQEERTIPTKVDLVWTLTGHKKPLSI